LNGSLSIAGGESRPDLTSMFPGLIPQFCTPRHTNADALTLMRDLNLHILVVVDEKTRNILGVVERDQIMISILLAAEPEPAQRK
jgi:CBS domain-containing protein